MSSIDRLSRFSDQPAPIFYASIGLPVHPVDKDKHPLTHHGYKDATLDLAQIAKWRRRWPEALWAAVMGEAAAVVAIDFDWRVIEGGIVWGIDSLDEAGILYFAATTPTAHTPSGGFHQLFRWPGRLVKSGPLWLAGKPVPGVDIKGDNSSLILPPGPDRSWDPILGPATPLAALPWWAVMS
jgi:putative DNA primase/helicase